MGYGYVRKTTDEFNILGDYGHGHGFELVTCEVTRPLARVQLRIYRESEPGTPFKIEKKRVRIVKEAV